MRPDHEPQPSPDPAGSSRWRPLRLLLAAMDDDIASLYDEAGMPGFRTRFTGPLILLGRRGPLTIRELADAMRVTHSAMSQTVAAMRRAGLVTSVAGGDARTRRVRPTRAARRILPFLEAEWRATEQAILELEEEIPYPLSQVVRDIEAALSCRPFRERVRDHLHPNPS